VISDNTGRDAGRNGLILNNIGRRAYRRGIMTRHLLIPALALAVSIAAVSAASAGCVVEYKAKKSNPTQYEHSTMSIPDDACTNAGATQILHKALSDRGWTLLAIVSVKKTG
jgi:hypothetical protein